MATRLIYHASDVCATSPFDQAIVAIAREGNLRLACPYIRVDYLERITALTPVWRLLTDVDEWAMSLPRSGRESAARFISSHRGAIRHLSGLHAKVAIGNGSALVGSANFTKAGIRERMEMSVAFEEEPQVNELAGWFEKCWERAFTVPPDQLSEYMRMLPERVAVASEPSLSLFPQQVPVCHDLENLPELLRVGSSTQITPAADHWKQVDIVVAILGAYPYARGEWLSAAHQVELLQIAYDAKLPDGRNAFPAMHGGADRGDATRKWDGRYRIAHRVRRLVKEGRAIKLPGQSQFMVAEGVTPADLGVSQALVDSLAAHNVITRYDVDLPA